MRFLAVASIAICVAICVLVVYLAITGYRRWRRRYLERHAKWVDVVVNTSDTTYISVQRVAETLTGRVVLDEIHIALVGHNNPNWGDHTYRYQQLAWDKAFALNQPPLE